MTIGVDNTGTIDGLRKILKLASEKKDVKGLLVMACESNNYPEIELDGLLKEISIPICGGLFPSIINNDKKMNRGAIVLSLRGQIDMKIVPGLSDLSIDYEKAIDSFRSCHRDAKTMILFLDAFSKRISSFLQGLFNIYGMNLNYIGGGTGSLNNRKNPSIFTNNGIKSDCAVIVLSDMESNIATSHGWYPIGGPYRVSESSGKTIKTLDWRPAYDVYREVVEDHYGKSLGPENFSNVAIAYPLGIARIDSERILRDPISPGKEGALECLEDVPEGSLIDILTADKSLLIESSRRLIKKNIPAEETKEGIMLLFNCISRALFLDERFEDELKAIYTKGQPLIGACAIGEIANDGNNYLEVYNKTSVMGILRP